MPAEPVAWPAALPSSAVFNAPMMVRVAPFATLAATSRRAAVSASALRATSKTPQPKLARPVLLLTLCVLPAPSMLEFLLVQAARPATMPAEPVAWPAALPSSAVFNAPMMVQLALCATLAATSRRAAVSASAQQATSKTPQPKLAKFVSFCILFVWHVHPFQDHTNAPLVVGVISQ